MWIYTTSSIKKTESNTNIYFLYVFEIQLKKFTLTQVR